MKHCDLFGNQILETTILNEKKNKVHSHAKQRNIQYKEKHDTSFL